MRAARVYCAGQRWAGRRVRGHGRAGGGGDQALCGCRVPSPAWRPAPARVSRDRLRPPPVQAPPVLRARGRDTRDAAPGREHPSVSGLHGAGPRSAALVRIPLMTSLVLLPIHLVNLTLVPLLLVGVVRKLKAWMQNRRGAPVLQPFYDT